MKKKTVTVALTCVVVVILIILLVVVFWHRHTWVEATCTEPKHCAECGETEGEPLGHSWIEATCIAPKTCSVCGETEGKTRAHTWVQADYENPKTCSVCGLTHGVPLQTEEEMLALIGTEAEREAFRLQLYADELGVSVAELEAMLAETDDSEDGTHEDGTHEDGTHEDESMQPEQSGTQSQQVPNTDSSYISERYGYQVGSQIVLDGYRTVTYQGGDVWIEEESKPYTVVKDHGNGAMEFATGIFAKEGEQPMSERLGYQPGDVILNHSLGYDFNRIYLGNDLWYDDNDPDDILIASWFNGDLCFTSYTWQ